MAAKHGGEKRGTAFPATRSRTHGRYRDTVADYVGRAREAIDDAVESELKDLRRAFGASGSGLASKVETGERWRARRVLRLAGVVVVVLALTPARRTRGRRGRTSSSAKRCCGRSALLPAARRRAAARVPVRLPVRLDRGRHEHREEVRADGTTLSLVERRASRSTSGARDEPLRAFALGYLAHLAADVVAHNYFVPHAARGHVEHVGARPQLLGEPLRDAPRAGRTRGGRAS